MHTEVHSNERFDVYAAITDKIVAAIEAGAGDFQMPWHRLGPSMARPVNAVTNVHYHGINVVALWAEAMMRGYGSGWWATFQQWNRLGARVRKGEHSTLIVVYKPRTRSNADEESDEERGPRLFARAYRVFNHDQVEGWRPLPEVVLGLATALEDAETFVTATGARVQHGGDSACYHRKEDLIRMPDRSRFIDTGGSTATEAYYSTLLHELTHWSGAEHRLNRQFGERFGDDAYAVEELVAELGAAFLCADIEITNEPRPDHAAYLTSWLRVLKSDRRAIFTAATRAKEAAAYVGSLADSAGWRTPQ